MIPGERSPQSLIEEMIRVDHAGEFGAQQIYKGQLAVLGRDASCADTIRHMAEQEQAHLARFETLMRERKVRPTALMPFWQVAGFALGAGTALLGKRAAMACTVAVETVIAEHYQEQLNTLGEQEGELADTIRQFRNEELEHHAIGLEHEAEQTPFYELLSGAIRLGCRTAIAVAKKV